MTTTQVAPVRRSPGGLGLAAALVIAGLATPALLSGQEPRQGRGWIQAEARVVPVVPAPSPASISEQLRPGAPARVADSVVGSPTVRRVRQCRDNTVAACTVSIHIEFVRN